MSGVGLSDAEKADLYGAHCVDVWLALLTVTHGSFATIRVVADHQNVTSRSNVYTAHAFSVRLPADRHEEMPQASIVIDNVDRSLVEAVRSVTTPGTVTIENIRRSDPDTVVRSWPNFELKSVEIHADSISLVLGPDPVLEESYPGIDFTPLLFPGLFDR
jgi:hypothetical protein